MDPDNGWTPAVSFLSAAPRPKRTHSRLTYTSNAEERPLHNAVANVPVLGEFEAQLRRTEL